LDIRLLIDEIARSAGVRVRGTDVARVAGGSIDRAYRIAATPAPIFVKVGAAATLPMYEVEALALSALREAGGVRVPDVLATGATSAGAFLVLEWIELVAPTEDAEAALGRGLAKLHRDTAPQYGWARDNRIGATRQPNAPADDWTPFFREQRLGFQRDLAGAAGLPTSVRRSLDRLSGDLEHLIGGHATRPSLVHGDLWGGNWGATADAEPVIFDPAVHYADREVDIAMTRLFGGFGRRFYAAYEAEWPLPDGWEQRAVVYNLYHLLNHYNLFGAGYLEQIRASLAVLGYSS